LFIDSYLQFSLYANNNFFEHLKLLNHYGDNFIISVFENINKYLINTDSDKICFQQHIIKDFKNKILKVENSNEILEDYITSLLADLEEKLQGCEDDDLPF